MGDDARVRNALRLLDLQFTSFFAVAPLAEQTGHPVPADTRGWSQILVSVLCGIGGLKRKKGADLADGSDVKAANTWEAIDTPRFNGVIKAGTKARTAGRLESLDSMPHLFLVLWDQKVNPEIYRCRIWAVRPKVDAVFRTMCDLWYGKHAKGEIVSDNFQLHPPRGEDTDLITNTCGNLIYPKYFHAERSRATSYRAVVFDPATLTNGLCKKAD